MRPPIWKGRRTQRICSFRGSYGNRGNGTELSSSDVVHRGNSNPNRPSDLHGKSARGDGSPLSRLSEADHFAPKARHQKRGNPNRISPFLVHLANPNPNPFLYQTRAQRQRVAAEKEKQGHRSMWRCLCRHMTSWPCFDVVPVTGLEPVRGCPQGILSPWCLPFHHTGLRLSPTVPPRAPRCQGICGRARDGKAPRRFPVRALFVAWVRAYSYSPLSFIRCS